MPLNWSTFDKMSTQQLNWRKEDAFDAIFLLRILVAVLTGLVWGIGGLEGLNPFIAYLALNVIIPKVWLDWQKIDVEEIEGPAKPDPMAPSPSLFMEGFGQALPLFMLIWISTFTVLNNNK